MGRSQQGQIKMAQAITKLKKQQEGLLLTIDRRINVQEIEIKRHQDKVRMLEGIRDEIDSYYSNLIDNEKG